jgi:hypothetical protein
MDHKLALEAVAIIRDIRPALRAARRKSRDLGSADAQDAAVYFSAAVDAIDRITVSVAGGRHEVYPIEQRLDEVENAASRLAAMCAGVPGGEVEMDSLRSVVQPLLVFLRQFEPPVMTEPDREPTLKVRFKREE